MNTTSILDKAETLSHHQRWKYMIELGKDSLHNQTLALSLQHLAESEIHYHRILALMSAHGSFDQAIIINLLEDPSDVGVNTVLSLAAKQLDSKLLAEIILKLSKVKRTKIATALLMSKRTDTIELIWIKSDACLQTELLFYTSEIFFREHLDQNQIESFTDVQWRHMTRRFPVYALEQIERVLKKSIEPSWRTKRAVQEVLCQLHKTAPTLGLTLIKRAIALIQPNWMIRERYFLLFPETIAKLLLHQPPQPLNNLPAKTLRKLSIEVLCALAEKQMLNNLLGIFPKLHPNQRIALYHFIGESLRSRDGSLPLAYTKALPKQIRQKESQHAFNLPLLEARPMERLPYLTFLSFTQALPLAMPFLNQPEGELRATAISSLIGCGRYAPDQLDNILDFCLKRENEQDPVRLAMMSALADLPSSRWTSSHLPKLSKLIKAVLEARDGSYQTMSSTARMLLNMITRQTDFVILELPVLVERMGRLNKTSLESRITNTDMIKLDACLYSLMKTWIARDMAPIAVSLIASFGCRIRSANKQLEEGEKLNSIQLLIDLTEDKRGHIARLGIDTLMKLKVRDECSQLIPALIKQDSSWMRVNCISEYIHQYQQHLLTPFLKPQVYKNRFSSGKTAILLAFDHGFLRWTVNQQQIYANSLNGFLTSSKRNAWELYQSTV